MGLDQVAALVMLYNLLAFGCQPLLGWLVDRVENPRLSALVGLGLLAASLLMMPYQVTAAIVLAGLGSAAFHVGGGALALCATRGRAAGPGLFASPGVLGLALGGALAITGHVVAWPFLVLLTALAAIIIYLELPILPYEEREPQPIFENHDLIMLVLLAAIALRSLVWSTLQLVMQAQVETLIALAIAAALGKVLGGFLADRFGWRRWCLAAMSGAAILLTLGANSIIALMLGVALLQSATPAALAAMLRLEPRRPATAAGLALGLGIALGGLPLTTPWGLSLGSPPILSLFAVTAAALLIGAITLQRRLGANHAQQVIDKTAI